MMALPFRTEIKIFTFVFLSLAVPAVSPLKAEDWPCWRGPRLDGIGIAGGLVASIGLCKANFFSSPLRKLRASRHGLGPVGQGERALAKPPSYGVRCIFS